MNDCTPQDYAQPCPFCGNDPKHTERPDNIDGTQFFFALACYCGGYSATAHKMAVRATPEEAKRDAIAAWNRRATQSGWLPIESAPRDGTPIILCYVSGNDDHGWFVAQGRWHEEDHDGPDNMGHDAGFMDDQFDFFRCARSFGNPAYQSEGLQPTHWQPLPPPPITKGESNV